MKEIIPRERCDHRWAPILTYNKWDRVLQNTSNVFWPLCTGNRRKKRFVSENLFAYCWEDLNAKKQGRMSKSSLKCEKQALEGQWARGRFTRYMTFHLFKIFEREENIYFPITFPSFSKYKGMNNSLKCKLKTIQFLKFTWYTSNI